MDQSKNRILLVDDHESTVSVLRMLLERRGFEVLTAGNVASALDIASREFVDLLICDIALPDGTGLDLIRQLHAMGPMKAIAMSGYGRESDIANSLSAGFELHLIKPF